MQHKTCGSWLASDGGGSGKNMLPGPASSLASQLPQVFVVHIDPIVKVIFVYNPSPLLIKMELHLS
jgi:hypothetical protein